MAEAEDFIGRESAARVAAEAAGKARDTAEQSAGVSDAKADRSEFQEFAADQKAEMRGFKSDLKARLSRHMSSTDKRLDRHEKKVGEAVASLADTVATCARWAKAALALAVASDAVALFAAVHGFVG